MKKLVLVIIGILMLPLVIVGLVVVMPGCLLVWGYLWSTDYEGDPLITLMIAFGGILIFYLPLLYLLGWITI